jgi:hypothetical protein
VISSGKTRLHWKRRSIAAFAVFALPLASAAAEEAIQFNKHIRPIFAEHCAACHGGVKQAGGLSFVYAENVFNGGDSGQPAAVPGDVESSYLIDRVTDPDPETRMPPGEHGPPLSAVEIERLKQWIAAGAKWETPWAFVPPKDTPPPAVTDTASPRTPLDRYVLAKLEAAKLEPAPPASRREWLRRVSFDLIGLPPSSAEVEAFERDERPDAFEHVVDRLLASPHFGERWASLWLDLARYADTTGYERDPHRNIWPYRDWLIRAFNADMPYDQFTIKQLAGDLVESPSFDDVLATAFHRNSQTNCEGGTDDEEYRIAAVIDRVNTTWQVWQATTFGCVQCHSHPYDPFRHDEYYQFMALFNSTRDSDIDEEYPTLRVPVDDKKVGEAAEIERERAELRRTLDAQARPLAEDAAAWRNLPIDKVESTGSTQLRIARDDTTAEPGETEVLAEGTVTAGSKFTLESPIPSDVDRITALRIDALLRDPEAARKIPQLGFILSQLEVELLPPNDAPPVKLAFAHALSDETAPLLDPLDSLNDDEWGWGSYSCQWRPHFGVFMLDHEVAVPPGSRLRITLHQRRATVGDGALVISRGRFAVTSNDSLLRLQAVPEFVAAKKKLRELKARADKIESVSVPVMGELADDHGRATFEFIRGLWLDKGAEVQPDTPDVLPPLATGSKQDRLAMARWLVSEKNPLTARVMVNRIWEQLFGIGIVETAEDFGTSGTPPSHPELLDHLALRFQGEQAWSIKQLLRELVLSSTYRQSARVSPEKLAADPQNRLLSRGPRQRLAAEMIRDQALVLSGRFSPKMFGPPVMPPQPDGIWRSVYSDAKWVNATDENRYRRALYTYWKRTSGYPSMATFDAPSREVCTARRITTNTPLQALVTLNDEAYVECAAGFADRMIAEGGKTPAERIAWAYRTATGSEPSESTRDDLVSLYDAALKNFTADPEGSKKVAATPKRAALAVVASAILNLDEVQTR